MIRAKKNTLLFQEALQNTYGLHFSNVYHRNKKKKNPLSNVLLR